MKENIKFITLAATPAINYSENTSFGGENKYIKFGADNKFDKYLYDLSNKSALHSGILDKKIKLDISNGLSWNKDNKKMNAFYSELDKNFLNDVFQSFEVVGGFFIGVKWLKGQIIDIESVPFDYCRLGEPNENDEIDNIMISKNWAKATMEKYKPVAVPTFTGTYKKNEYEIAYIFRSTLGQWYPTPSYYAATNYIQSDYEISKFHLSNIVNGFNPGAFIVFTEGNPTPEQKRNIEEQIEGNKGAQGAGKYVLYYAENKDNVPVITQLPVNDLDKQFVALNEIIDNKILISHQMLRILAGLETSGSLGDANQLYQARTTFYQSYSIPQQNVLLNFLNEINAINGISDEVTIEPIKIQDNALVIGMIDKVKEYFSEDEIRNIFGFENKTETPKQIL